MKTTKITVDLIEKQTDKAILVRSDSNNTSFWIPKSQILGSSNGEIIEKTEDELIIPMWLAYRLCDAGKISRIDFLS